MPPSPRSDSPDPDLLRRLREFQVQVRHAPRKVDVVVPARGPLSARDVDILARLRRQSESLADSLEQVLKDLNDHTLVLRSATEPFDTATAMGRMLLQMLGIFPQFELGTRPPARPGSTGTTPATGAPGTTPPHVARSASMPTPSRTRSPDALASFYRPPACADL